MMRVVVAGRDAPLWLAASTIARALAPASVTVEAIELPPAMGPGDAYATLPPLEALHAQLRVDEDALLRLTQGAFTLGQNFADASGEVPAFLHPYGSFGAPIDGHDFFAYWLKARLHGLNVPLEDFSLTAAAARHGRLMLPDDDSERYGRCDYGYHLPALAYARVLKGIAAHHGVTVQAAETVTAERDADGRATALLLDGGRRVEGDLFVDATGPEALLIGGGRESWRSFFPADRVFSASGARFAAIPAYAEVRASAGGWTALYPSPTGRHVVHAWSSALTSDEDALGEAAAAFGVPLAAGVVRSSEPGRRPLAWEGNIVAIGEAACGFDPFHGVDLHAVQLGLINLLACFPASADYGAQRDEYNRVMQSSFERVRDFQSAHYALARWRGPFWDTARAAEVPAEVAQRIDLFRARGEIAPFEEESFAPDSWRTLFVGHGLVPESWLPAIDRTAPDEMKAQFRRMLGFVREQVLKAPTHDQVLATIAQRHG